MISPTAEELALLEDVRAGRAVVLYADDAYVRFRAGLEEVRLAASCRNYGGQENAVEVKNLTWTFSWRGWLKFAADGGAVSGTVRLSDHPEVLHRAQGDSTVYSLRRGGKEWMIHDKAAVRYDDMVRELLHTEWPGVTFILPQAK